MEDNDNSLSLYDENGVLVNINVLDILDENEFGVEFIIYTLEGDDKTVYASILNEKEDSYSLDTIYDENQMQYINNYIETTIQE